MLAPRPPAARTSVRVDDTGATGGRSSESGYARGSGRGRRQPTSEASIRAEAEADADPLTLARTIVLRKLSAHARTRHELATALAARGVPEAIATQVLDRMEEVGLVDDQAFAHDWVESRQQRRHLSRSALRRELQSKGVDREQIDDAVGKVEGADELAAAEALAIKRFRSMQGLARDVQYRRLAGALARRGFNGSVAGVVISRVLNGVRD